MDREAGIVYGVKILGRYSQNSHKVEGVTGTEYTIECLKKAAPLYENLNVNVDHPSREKPNSDRSALDRIGWIENIEAREDGLYAELHLNPKHKFTESFLWSAENKPTMFGLSHNAWGQGEKRGDTYVVTEIPEARSVDIVADAGSTRSLFESKEGRKMLTIRKVFEAALPKCHRSKRTLLKHLIEACDDDDGMKKVMEEEMPPESEPVAADVAAVAADPNQALKDGFKAAMIAVLDDDTMDAAAKLKKLKDLLTTHEKLTSEPVEEPMVEADEEEDEDEVLEADEDPDKKPVAEADEDPDKKPVAESKRGKKPAGEVRQLREELDQLKRRETVRAECSAAGIHNPTPGMMKALVLLTESKDRKELIETFSRSVRAGERPRSQAQGGSGASSKVSDGRSLAAALKN